MDNHKRPRPLSLFVQMMVQAVLVVVALCAVPVLLLGKPIHLYVQHKRRGGHLTVCVCVCVCVCDFSLLIMYDKCFFCVTELVCKCI